MKKIKKLEQKIKKLNKKQSNISDLVDAYESECCLFRDWCLCVVGTPLLQLIIAILVISTTSSGFIMGLSATFGVLGIFTAAYYAQELSQLAEKMLDKRIEHLFKKYNKISEQIKELTTELTNLKAENVSIEKNNDSAIKANNEKVVKNVLKTEDEHIQLEEIQEKQTFEDQNIKSENSKKLILKSIKSNEQKMASIKKEESQENTEEVESLV